MSAGPREDGSPLDGRRRSPRMVVLSDRLFLITFSVIGGTYVILIVGMLLANVAYMVNETWRTARQTAARQQFENLDRNGDRLLGDEDFAVAESEKENARLIAAWDADDDGTVSFEEFQKATAENRPDKAGDDVDGTTPQQLFDDLDKDDDGRLSFDEFQAASADTLSKMTEKDAAADTAKMRFEKLDKNRDDQLSVDDYPAVAFEEKRRQLLESCDANDDAQVSIEEFQAAPAETRFNMSDADEDGELTLDEFRGRRDTPSLLDKTELVFRRLDQDGDERVTPAEFEVQRHPLKSGLLENPVTLALADPKIQYSIWLSLVACTLSGIFSLWVAVPAGYLMSRHRLPGSNFIDAVLDVPIVLPPLVVGLSLLILFQFPPFSWFARHVVYQIPAVVLAQFSVACAFAVRTMKATFDHIDPRCEEVALSLGCTRLQAFGWVVLPEARRGMMTAFTLAWARSLGEFGPLLIFAGVTRMKTEVLSTSVFLEVNVGNVEAAVAVSLIMVLAAAAVLTITRLWGSRDLAL